jgi:arylsulfatase A-like enzyme
MRKIGLIAKWSLITTVLFPLALSGQDENIPVPQAGQDHPNILWIYIEDTNPWMSCYGDKMVNTPTIDQLAENGVRFERAYVTSGVCSATRSALITGMYQTSIGAHNHHGSYAVQVGDERVILDPIHLGIRTLPEIFKAAGYYTFNEGKDHYNFIYSDKDLYDRKGNREGFQGATDGSEWSGRAEGQPFFGQIQLRGGKYPVSRIQETVRPEDVRVPPYYPDIESFRNEIARHYNQILKLDEILGMILDRLKEDGLYENTIVFFFSDHGLRLPRHKQFLYEGGIRVPLIVAGPGIPVHHVRNDLVSSIDISATTLALAGIQIPAHMQGMDMFSEDFNRDYAVAARDRCDYTIDRIRAVVTDRYKYIRNFMTDKPYLQPQYRDNHPAMKDLKAMYQEGELNDVQARFVSDERPAEEFYDLWEDPHETRNLVHSYKREHAMELARHRDMLYKWILETDDKGRFPESEAGLRTSVLRYGEKAVNKEYQEVREKEEAE